jgi:hypothetical protein
LAVSKKQYSFVYSLAFFFLYLLHKETVKMAAKAEIQVIDDRLLIEGILEERMVNEADANRLTGEVNLVELAPTVETLSLSFKRISKIENLVGFEKLIKLCLDNNSIEEISNLSHLTSLKWLDLSFNKIRKIQGLESLINLEDLSLYSNKISSVEGLEKCTKLQCLSLGNNRIDSMEQIIRLRQIRSLKMLTLADNPICKESEYRMIVLAYVDNITYLDYALIDSNDRMIAKEQYHDELLDVEEKESVLAEKISRDTAMTLYLKKLADAGIVFAHSIFDDLFIDDNDVERLKHLPGIKEQIEAFRSSFKAISEEYITNSLEKYDKRRKEISEFEKAVKSIRTHDDYDSTQLIDSYNKSKKSISDSITNALVTVTHFECQRMVKGLQEELDNICDELMNVEIRQVEKFESLIDEFENRCNELKNESLESQQLFFRSIEELEEKFCLGLKGVATDLIDRLAREELAEDYLDDEAMSLVMDKDTCMTVLSASHDLHIGRILKKEDEARGSEMKRFQELLSKYANEESARNRNRILQVHDFSRNGKTTLHALLSSDDDEGFEEDEIQHGSMQPQTSLLAK